MRLVRIPLIASSLLLVSAANCEWLLAQSADTTAPRPTTFAMVERLPDSPGASRFTESGNFTSSSSNAFDWQQAPPASNPPKAGAPGTTVYPRRFATKIAPGLMTQPLSSGDKFTMSIVRQFTLGTLASSLFSAGFSHLQDGRPHYGTDRAGFGERLGASALRSTSQSVFNYGVYASLFHDDQRYYVLGPQFPAKKRVIYAATRVIFTRKDDGRKAFNYPYLAAVASSAALTNAYYPDRDRSVGRTVSGVFTTLALNAGIMQLNEFGTDIRRRIFHRHDARP